MIVELFVCSVPGVELDTLYMGHENVKKKKHLHSIKLLPEIH